MLMAPDDETLAHELARNREWEETTFHGPYRIADLRRVFDRLCDPGDWKAPILAKIPHETFSIAKAAVAFFTGSELKVEALLTGCADGGKLRVSADGYRAVIGA
jgi:hypothetical protein